MTKINRFLEINEFEGIKVFHVSFKSLSDIEYYLSSNPAVNTMVFYNENSIKNPVKFAGAPYEQALGYLIGGYDKGYDKFLELKKELDRVNIKESSIRRSTPAFVGSRPHVANYLAGAPKQMYRLDKGRDKKFINIRMNLSYGYQTTEEQIINRGLLVLNLISLLEEHGYGVNFKVYQSAVLRNELFFCEINLKNPDERLNVKRCYYPLCAKEFLRRILARVTETMPFKEEWGFSYGSIVPEQLDRKITGVLKDDILILSPEACGITGKDLFLDADTFLDRLKLSDMIRVPKYRMEDR